MPLPSTKQELLGKLYEAYEKLDAEFAGLTAKSARLKELEGKISACDVVAYQIGWGRLLCEWDKSEKRGVPPEMPAKGYKWNELGKLAASFYNEHKASSLSQLRKTFKATVDNIAAMIDEMTEREIFQRGHRDWAGEKWPVVKWIQVNTIAPYTSARTKVRRWKKNQRPT